MISGLRNKNLPAPGLEKIALLIPAFMPLVLRQVSNDGQRINPKHEIRNSKQTQMTKTKTIPQHRITFVLNFEIWNFGFVSDFDIRISNLLSLYDNRGLTQH
jgi:hypothetical protein